MRFRMRNLLEGFAQKANRLGGFVLLWAVLSPDSGFSTTSTDTLPAGRRALGYVYGFASGIESAFNASGNLESLAKSLNRSVTLDDLARREPQLNELRSVLNSLTPGSLGESLLMADLYSTVRVNEERKVFALFWGLTDDIMVGAVVPLIHRKIQADFRAEVVNNAEKVRGIVGDVPKLDEGLKKLAETPIDTSTFQRAIFTSRGFQPPGSFEASGLGDVETELRYTYLNRPSLNLAFRTTVIAPTSSHQPDIRNLLDKPLGDGCFALRLSSMHTVKLVPDVLAFESGIMGTWFAPARQTLALPRDPQEDLADLNDPGQIEAVRKQLGPKMDLDLGLDLLLWKGMVELFGSYQFSVKAQDRYWGDQGLDYARLMEGTRSVSHGIEAGIAFSTLPLFRAGKVPAPGKISFRIFQPIAGVNSIYAGYGRLDALLFF